MHGFNLFGSATLGIRTWLVGLFVQAIERAAAPEDRHAAILWLLRSRDILAGPLAPQEKLLSLNEQIRPRTAVFALAGEIAAAVMGYRTADVPWAVKLAIPTALFTHPVSGWPVVGLQAAGLQAASLRAAKLQAAGIAAFGTAVGLPGLLLAFLGTSGITAIIEAMAGRPQSAAAMALVAARILRADCSQQAARWIADAMIADPVAPCAAALPRQAEAIRAALLALDTHSFDRHVLSFFERAGLEAVVTPGAKERGLDGYAQHPEGLVVVQCRRPGPADRLGSPALDQFRGVMADGRAWRGYLVTTSCFTAGAVSAARKEKGFILVDMDEFLRWHSRGLNVV